MLGDETLQGLPADREAALEMAFERLARMKSASCVAWYGRRVRCR